jgi:tetratricopeptide (TPR) repeat protein
VATNALNTRPVGPRIDPATHSRHKAGERGDACVDCHMPVATYMQRHPRHDHGFTIPDPRLTKQFNIPNACNRCHADKSADWSLAAIEKWYGTRTNHTVLARTEAIVRARRGEAAALPGLLQLAGESTNAYWRAVALNFLRPWGTATNVLNRLLSGAMDTNALVRSVSVRALESGLSAGHPEAIRTAREKLADPVRSVRIEAAWALRREVDTNSPAGRDLLAHLRHNADQPQGQMQLGVFQFDRGDVVGATASLRLAISWDPNSAPLHDTLAVILSAQGRSAEAVASLQSAVRLAPNQAEYRYRLGLAFSEIGELRQAQASLAEAVRLEPGFARAWYNLGLAQSSLQQPEAALESLIRAESLDSNSAMIPYARATILARLGRANEARTAAQRALELDRNFTAARQLLQALP